jgi:MFS family permease
MHHPVETAVATAAALVALAFASSTFERWQARRRRHEAAWSVALLLFAVAAGALATGAQSGWSGPVFRVFYLFGAIVNVPVLALGTVYLLAGSRVGDRVALAVVVFSAFAAGVVVTAPFTHAVPVNELAQGSRVFGPLPRILAAVGSAGGALVIFAGAAWSGWRVRRAGAGSTRRLVWSNGLIALGTLILGGSGTLNSVFGAMTAFAVTLLIGIVVIFAGFLVATGGGSPAPVRAVPPAEPWWPPEPEPEALADGAGTEGSAQQLPAQAIGQ